MSQSRAFLRCPHCDTPAIVRTSVLHSKLLRESVLQCRNALCGHTFSAYTEIVRTHTQSACPRGDVCLPISSSAERAALSARAAPEPVTPRKARR
ncbi:TPA: ogr/Delta-like zinc finger family protein [Stenotrophomonas maltophilia]|nr:ogr/Delta-like zinc finger family protein [Stenotrophomonas maltophilia]HDX0804957.1 ogr/Delta-like zinc finger family protein [Stenotrophomonas maltophilia]HDX0818571.1 ogr/Delta-like zinc finger family protein [Stenotrophomonas maltophilia]HDX0831821.1 ogr/Delta-like zinc finger family protein [Stenotrophomonas maltophilia]HDX0855736.1 ogr/Delta-like zinc finger family protein [Stenotrophomonas maltophilia]